MEKSLTELSADIIKAQARSRRLSVDELLDGLKQTFQVLHELHHGDQNAPPLTKNESTNSSNSPLDDLRRHPLKSIQRDHVICLESGKPYQLLSNRHLAQYGLTPREYKKKWGFPLTTSLSSKKLTKRRSRLAKQLGAGTELAVWRAKQATQPRSSTPSPSPTPM